MTQPARTFSFIRDVDVAEGAPPPVIDLNGTIIRLSSELASIDLVLFAAASGGDGAGMLRAISTLFRQVIDSRDYDLFIRTLRDPAIGPKELGEIAQGIVEVYIDRPTNPS